MGLGLSKPKEPWAVTAFALASPVVYIDFLQLLVRFAAETLHYDAATFGNLLKAIGAPFFVFGQATLCLKKPAHEFPDKCYIGACALLSAAFSGAFMKKPIPEAIFTAGLLLFGAYLPLRWQALAKNAPTLLPNIATGAAPILTLVGLTQMAIKYGYIEKAPAGPITMAQAATCAGTIWCVVNCIRLLQLIQGKAPRDHVFKGQVMKVIASLLCFTGNTLNLGWHKKTARSESLLRIAAALVVARSISGKK